MDGFDLHRHAVLEASAGTGKTHAIERIVLRLLAEAGVRLEEILIVTYTEKATGELKARLRAALEAELAKEPDAASRGRLERAVDHFDQACIFTLHGFCHRVLQDYPLELGYDGGGQLVKDGEFLDGALREVQRRIWRQEYGDNLREVLVFSGYERSEVRKWERRVCELVRTMHPECGDRLEPPAIAAWPNVLRTVRTMLDEARPKLRALFDAHANFGTLEFLREWATEAATESQPLTAFRELFVQVDQPDLPFRTQGFPCLLATAKLTGPVRPAAAEILRLLDEIRLAADWNILFDHQLMLRTVTQVRELLEEHKKQQGWQTFQDMIAGVARGLDPKENPRAHDLAGKLRQRFRYGIVDEFQDTDPLQWQILERIFLHGDAARLFVVGDPKQAIFGFRGADLPTYLQAADEMLHKHHAQDCPLRVNWRSTPELLTALNRLFQEGQWFPTASGIRYLPVEAAPAAKRPCFLVEDDSGRPALTVVDWRREEAMTKLRRRHSQFIVAEIARLLGGASGKPLLAFTRKNVTRPLSAGDICVQIFRRSEADALVAGLRAVGIPFSFYKQPGLWKSDEAVHLDFVLRALAQPENRGAFRRALLTQFFRLPAEELAVIEDLSARHPARQLFERWLDLAASRKWSALFQSLLEDTGVLFQDGASADRRRANYRHLANFLVYEAYRKNLDLLGLVDLFQRRDQAVTDDDVQPRETDHPRVQIMTIHASKGLEFPVVFLAGGWTRWQAPDQLSFRDEQKRLVYEVSASAEAKDAAKSDKLDEDRRLLYVALTRAMFKLYVPLVLENCRAFKGHQAQLANLLAPALIRAGLAESNSPSSDIIDLQNGPLPIPTHGPDAEPVKSVAPWKLDGPLFPAVDANLSRRGIVIRSFSSLHRAALREQEASFAEEPARLEEEVPIVATQEQEDPLRGPTFGNLVHDVLENIDFAAVSQAPKAEDLWLSGSATARVLEEEIAHYLPRLPARLPEKELRVLCRTRVAELVWHALNTQLPDLGCALGQVPPQDRLAEVEFHFPEEEGTEPRSELGLEEGFLTGFMDLVVRRAGRYYLVDWKTNLLPGYTPDDVANAMTAADYHRQYRLYLQALARWLHRNLGPTFNWQRDLAGVYYLFVRGLGAGQGNGVFFRRPRADDLRLESVLPV